MNEIAVMLLTVASLSASTQTFKSSVDAVRVDVLATRADLPIKGLTAADFELRDNGVVQQIVALTVEDVPLNLILALDTSSSVEGRTLSDLKDAAAALIGLLHPADQAAVLTFDGTIRLAVDWTESIEILKGGIAQAKGSGGTALHDAAYAALMMRKPRAARLLVLLFSDGADSGSWLSGARVVELAGRTEGVVYAIEVKRGVPSHFGFMVDVRSGVQGPLRMHVPEMKLMVSFLDALTSETGGQLFQVDETNTLRETFMHVISEFRSRYVLTYTPRGVSNSGWHRLQVKTHKAGIKVSARRGYWR